MGIISGTLGVTLILAGIFGSGVHQRLTGEESSKGFFGIPFPAFSVLGAVILFFSINPFVYNADGERTYVQDPFLKTEKIIFDPGYSWGGFFHRATEWPDVMSTVLEDVPVRFNDATQARADANVRWEMPKDEGTMINLHKSYRSPQKLQERTLSPYSQECLGFASQLMELI